MHLTAMRHSSGEATRVSSRRSVFQLGKFAARCLADHDVPLSLDYYFEFRHFRSLNGGLV